MIRTCKTGYVFVCFTSIRRRQLQCHKLNENDFRTANLSDQAYKNWSYNILQGLPVMAEKIWVPFSFLWNQRIAPPTTSKWYCPRTWFELAPTVSKIECTPSVLSTLTQALMEIASLGLTCMFRPSSKTSDPSTNLTACLHLPWVS